MDWSSEEQSWQDSCDEWYCWYAHEELGSIFQAQTEPVRMNKEAKTIPVTELHTFVQLITAWHQNRVATAEHLAQIPEGIELKVDGEEGSLVLEESNHASFVLGVNMTLALFKTLPFGIEYEEEATADEVSE